MYLDGHYVSDKSCDQIRQAALDHGVELMTIPGTEFEGDEGFQLSRDWRFSLRE
ncbi:hypothetical protein E4U46_007324 [Claviceps purpurea]|nr:hypothetical protein E4U46_007324 [Claviceps purpurea]